ncbi:MAG: EVE domain-containing protein [Bryobacteraceae bacterium]|nr:EVE domain-containing protein [Bryobacteraceae bacterium]
MAWFLAKTDPQTYSIEQLKADGRTVWDGVANPQAAGFIRSMKKGDKVFIYHSGGESAIVGLAKVDSAPRTGAAAPKSWVADFRFLGMIEPPIRLSEIKSSGLFNDWLLVRQGRLSTMPVPDEFVDWVRARYPRLKL